MTITDTDSEFVQFDGIFNDVKIDTLKQLYHDIAHLASSISPLETEEILGAFINGGQESFSALGNGFAYPNFKSDKLTKPVIMMVKLHEPLETDTPDGKPIEIAVLVVSPKSYGARHLRLLSRVVRMFRDKALCANLKSAHDLDALHAIMEYRLLDQNAA